MDFRPVLKSDLIVLRPLEEADREALFAVASDPRVWEQHPQNDRWQRPVFDAFFEKGLQSNSTLVVIDTKTGKVIGASRYYEWNPAEKSVSIGYTFLAPACWGGGYNRHMKKLMLDHAFRFVETVFFHIGKDNARSRKAMEKIGGKLVGEETRERADGSPFQSMIYSIKKPRRFSGSELVIATHNKGKLAEIAELFHGVGVNLKLYSAADFNLASPEETGTTCLENATLKAKYVAEKTGKPALSDDSGLFVAALDGAPGVYSADWAELPGGGRDFGVAMKKVHEAMRGSTDTKAYFTSVLALCWPDGHCETVEGFVHGNIVWPPRGNQGHGYDPIFMPQGSDKTYGEIPTTKKEKTSHRADAFAKLMDKCFQ